MQLWRLSAALLVEDVKRCPFLNVFLYELALGLVLAVSSEIGLINLNLYTFFFFLSVSSQISCQTYSLSGYEVEMGKKREKRNKENACL